MSQRRQHDVILAPNAHWVRTERQRQEKDALYHWAVKALNISGVYLSLNNFSSTGSSARWARSRSSICWKSENHENTNLRQTIILDPTVPSQRLHCLSSQAYFGYITVSTRGPKGPEPLT